MYVVPSQEHSSSCLKLDGVTNRVKTQGWYSNFIHDTVGVNQGGNLSPGLFREYLSDQSQYMKLNHGILMGTDIIGHVYTDTPEGLQTQINGLYTFCRKNQMIVNNAKTKVMLFGKCKTVDFTFNGNTLEITDKYKYLGNIFSTIRYPTGNPLYHNFAYLQNKGRNAIFAVIQKIKSLGRLPIVTYFSLFDSLVKPILLYGSDVWGARIGKTQIDIWGDRQISN